MVFICQSKAIGINKKLFIRKIKLKPLLGVTRNVQRNTGFVAWQLNFMQSQLMFTI